MAHRTPLEAEQPPKSAKPANQPSAAERRRGTIFDAFRRWGYYESTLDPIGLFKPLQHPDLAFTGPVADEARGYYCGTIGAEFMHLPEPERRQWIAERIEAPAPEPDQAKILERLIRADLFEQVLQARYLGAKRFSLEGVTALIPMLDAMFEVIGEHGAIECVMAMSHRGRLNVMTHAACKPAHEVVSGFEDVDPRSVLGAGDVKYHVGATGSYCTTTGKSIRIHLVSNPSHLEAVDPVAVGRARAKQARLCGRGTTCVFPMLLHGDAAFAGQGAAAETLNLSNLDGYTVGGTVHVVVNNLIGFTANPEDTSSSRFAADVAKRLPIPIFHVNAQDPDAAVRVAR